MNKFTGPGSTPSRRRFWDKVQQAVTAAQKKAGRNASVDEREGQGTVINFPDQTPSIVTGACCIGTDCTITTEADCEGDWQGPGTVCDPNPCTADCTSCDDLPPTNPSGPPVHINIVRTMSGSCGDMTFSGSVTYDLDLGFSDEDIGGHSFCAHNILNNGFGEFWSGHFTKTCGLDGSHADFGSLGFNGALGRDKADCSWWLDLDAFALGVGGGTGSCSGCAGLTFTTIFQEIAGAGDPTGVYVITETMSGVTMTTTITIT